MAEAQTTLSHIDPIRERQHFFHFAMRGEYMEYLVRTERWRGNIRDTGQEKKMTEEIAQQLHRANMAEVLKTTKEK